MIHTEGRETLINERLSNYRLKVNELVVIQQSTSSMIVDMSLGKVQSANALLLKLHEALESSKNQVT